MCQRHLWAYSKQRGVYKMSPFQPVVCRLIEISYQHICYQVWASMFGFIKSFWVPIPIIYESLLLNVCFTNLNHMPVWWKAQLYLENYSSSSPVWLASKCFSFCFWDTSWWSDNNRYFYFTNTQTIQWFPELELAACRKCVLCFYLASCWMLTHLYLQW